MSEIQYQDISEGTNIEVYNRDNTLVGVCNVVAYTIKENKGRLVLRENISLNFNDRDLKVLITGIGQGIKYQVIRGVVFDKNQDYVIDNQLTFTFNKVSDWERIKDLNNEY